MVSELAFDSSYGAHPGRSLVEFEDRLSVVAGVRNAADGALVDMMVEALREDFWQGHGIHSPVQWLMWQTGVARVTARRVTTIAARGSDLPVTLGLLREGRLSLDQAHAVARYTPAEFEESVCSLAQSATVNQIISATRTYCFDVEQACEPHRRRSTAREAGFGFDEDGTWWARIRLAAEEGALVQQALGAVRETLHDEARETAKAAARAEGRSTTGSDSELGVPATTWADAVVGMATSVLSHGVTDATAQTRRRIHIHLEIPTKASDAKYLPLLDPATGQPVHNPETEQDPEGLDGLGDSAVGSWGWYTELHGGHHVPEWLARQLTCDCDISVVWEKHGKALSTSENYRTPSDRLRRIIEHRDRYRCRVPGCTETRWLQIHHIIHWEDNGKTLTHNLVLLCGRHHRMHHQGLLGITGNADIPDHPGSDRPVSDDKGGLVFTTEHGLIIEPTGVPTRPRPGDFPTVGPYRHPTGEKLYKHWVHFNRNDPPAAGARAPSDEQLTHTNS